MTHLTLGVLGGMGPAATADFYSRLIALDPAVTDQEHLPVILWADPRIPDRVAAVRGTGPSPAPERAAGLRGLARGGAGVIVMPCNTAHAFLDDAIAAAGLGPGVAVIDMIEVTVEAARRRGAQRVGLLATAATLEHVMYQRRLTALGVEVVVPSAPAQSRLLGLIKAAKEGVDAESLLPDLAVVVNDVTSQGADHVIVACTEVSPVAGGSGTEGHQDEGVGLIDASEELAAAALAVCRGADRAL